MWCRGAETPAGLAFAAGHRCLDVLRSFYALSLRRRHVTAVSLPESCWLSLSLLPTRNPAKLWTRQATAFWPRLSAVCTSLGLQRRHGGHPQGGVRGLCKRDTSLRARVRRDVSGALQTRGDLIRHLRQPCGLLVRYSSQTRVSARAAPSSPSTKIGAVDSARRHRRDPGGLVTSRVDGA